MRAFDYVLIGGGLQNALIAGALAKYRPAARVALVERAESLGAGHTWCFHGTDLSAEFASVARPFVDFEWDGHEVAFPGHRRNVPGSYHCITGERFDRTVRQLFKARAHYHLVLGKSAHRIDADAVELEDGERLAASVVIDARGPERLEAPRIAGYQKFLGLELELAAPSGLERPILMDARVAQIGGYRFMYALPFTPTRVLLEDTYFSDTPELDRATLRNGIVQYAIGRGFSIERVIREEVGVLPLPARLHPPSLATPLAAGYRGGWFHPTTGYSFPVAARLAELIAKSDPGKLDGGALALFSREHGRQVRFATLLNRLLFDGFEDETRLNVFERFYRLPAPTIHRFYSLSTSPLDRARILCGRPPRGISIRRVVRRGIHP